MDAEGEDSIGAMDRQGDWADRGRGGGRLLH